MLQALLTLLLLTAVLPHISSAESQSPVCLVQLSDLHISDFNATKFHIFGDRLGDLRLLSETVLRGINPQAMLLTGDLTDGKSPTGSGRQSLTEWQDYRSLVETMKQEIGLSEGKILDIRGNHDTFNVATRSGQNDLFALHAASGIRNASARVFSKEIASSEGGQSSCPGLVTIGLDLVPVPGLAGLNFFGRAPPGLISEVEQELKSISRNLRKRGCNEVPMLAYGHYPLEVIAHSSFLPIRPEQHVLGATHLRTVLARHGVSTYVAGHLHAAFGSKLHRMHAYPGGFLAELETSAWLNDRRFRILCYHGSSMSFSDLHFHSRSNPRWENQKALRDHPLGDRAFAITGEITSQQVKDYIILITSPPSARYSPLLTNDLAQQTTFDSVSAMIFPLTEDGSAGPRSAELSIHCEETDGVRSSRHAMKRAGKAVWGAKGINLDCLAKTVTLQVRSDDGSTSEAIPVALSQAAARSYFSAPQQPVGITRSFLEEVRALTLWIDWPTFGHWTMYSFWSIWFFGMLLIPAIASHYGWRERLWTWLARKVSLQRHIWRIISYPAVILMDQASVKELWVPQLVYGAYLWIGPWGPARFLEGEPLGLFWMGRIMYYKGGVQHWWYSVDTSITVVMVMVPYILPMTLLCASVASRNFRTGARQRPWWALMNVPQVAWLVAVQLLGCRVLYRFGYGPLGKTGFLLSPGVAWTIPFYLVLLLQMLWRTQRSAPSSMQLSKKASSDEKSE